MPWFKSSPYLRSKVFKGEVPNKVVIGDSMFVECTVEVERQENTFIMNFYDMAGDKAGTLECPMDNGDTLTINSMRVCWPLTMNL